MKNLCSRRGETYIETCVGMFVLLMTVVLILNVFHFITLKQDMEEMGNQLMEVATSTGGFGEEFRELTSRYETEYGCRVETSAERYFDASHEEVQLGDVMTVRITVVSHLQGMGAIEIPITAQVQKSGISEKYWK